MTPFFVVPLQFRDIHSIYHLEQDIFPLDAYPYLDLAVMLLTPGMRNLKAIDPNNEFLGFIAVADVWFRPDTRPAWVITLGVMRAFQNQGIGGQLLREAELQLKANHIRLTVRRSNTPAIHLYERSEYLHVKTHPAYYRNGEDGLIMEKNLNKPE